MSSLMGREPGFLLHDANPRPREALLERVRGRETDDPASDHENVRCQCFTSSTTASAITAAACSGENAATI